MKNEVFLERDSERTPDVEEPHFEEAWTVLAARPVVPLREEANRTVRATLKLIAAFAGASLLGVLVALASIRVRQVSGSVTETEVPVQSDSLGASENTPVIEQTATAPEAEAPPLKTPSRVTEAAKRPSVQSTAHDQKTADTADDTPQPRLTDEWQERRSRRATIRRQRREIDDLHHRDLLRIQEIFEGRRPRNP